MLLSCPRCTRWSGGKAIGCKCEAHCLVLEDDELGRMLPKTVRR